MLTSTRFSVIVLFVAFGAHGFGVVFPGRIDTTACSVGVAPVTSPPNIKFAAQKDTTVCSTQGRIIPRRANTNKDSTSDCRSNYPRRCPVCRRTWAHRTRTNMIRKSTCRTLQKITRHVAHIYKQRPSSTRIQGHTGERTVVLSCSNKKKPTWRSLP